MDAVNAPAKFEIRSFTRSGSDNNWSFLGAVNQKSWGRGGSRGSGMVPFEGALLSS